MQAIRYALRTLRLQPGFTLLALAAIGIGIGTNTAVFSVVYAVLLKSLPYARPDEIVFITEVQRGTSNSVNVPPANYLDYQTSSAFQAMGAAEAWGATLTGFGAPERARGLRLTASLFDVLGVPPMLGRALQSADEQPGNDRVVVLSHAFWRRRFGGDTSIAGRTIELNGEPWRVIGVMPPQFRFAPFWVTSAQVFAPLSFDAAARASRERRSLRVFARLSPGTTPQSAADQLKAVFVRAAQASPGNNARLEPTVTPLNEVVTGKVRNALAILLGAVGLVLLIACANVATLVLVRTIARRRDIALRLSLGATRWQLLRHYLVESVVLAASGGVLGILLASTGIDALSVWFSASMPRHEEIGINVPVVVFTGCISMLSAVLLSLASVFQVSSISIHSALKESSRSVGGSLWSNRLRRTLTVSQIAFSLVLLTGAGLLIRSLVLLQSREPGFKPANVVTGSVHTWGTSAAEPGAQMNLYRAVLDRVGALPDVAAVALINHLPLAGDMWSTVAFPEGRPDPLPGEQTNVVYRVVTANYFSAMSIPLLRGRAFTGNDVNGSLPVAVISEAMARQVWAGEDAVGKRLRLGEMQGSFTVAGVVRDVVQQDWIAGSKPEIYLPLEQHPEAIGRPHSSSMTLIARTASDAAPVRNALPAAVASVNASVPVTDVQTLDDIVANATQGPRVYASLLSIFAFSAVVLALIGLYGVVAYDASRRTREIGVRIAVGAQPSDVAVLVLRDALRMVLTGGVLGLGSALVASRWLASMLYGITSTDAPTLWSVTTLFGAVTCLAAYLPARRAAHVDPVHALRAD